MRWSKVLANTGLTFFTTMTGLLTADGLKAIDVPFDNALVAAAIVSSLHGGAAFCREILAENKNVRRGIKMAKSKGYVTQTENMEAVGELHWRVGLIKTLKDRKMCNKTKLFACLDCATI